MNARRFLSIAVVLALFPIGASGDGVSSRHELADLADGETRTFGSGDHAVEAFRAGDLVTLTFAGPGGGSRELRVDLTAGGGTVTVNDSTASEGRAARASVEVPESQRLRIQPLFETSDGRLLAGERLLRCPEGGDTLMKAPRGDGASYRCPRHGHLLEPDTSHAGLGVFVTPKGDVPRSFESRTMGGGERPYSGKPLSLDF